MSRSSGRTKTPSDEKEPESGFEVDELTSEEAEEVAGGSCPQPGCGGACSPETQG